MGGEKPYAVLFFGVLLFILPIIMPPACPPCPGCSGLNIINPLCYLDEVKCGWSSVACQSAYGMMELFVSMLGILLMIYGVYLVLTEKG